jgi:hypothetical protein
MQEHAIRIFVIEGCIVLRGENTTTEAEARPVAATGSPDIDFFNKPSAT